MVARLRVDESEYYIDTGLTNLSTIHTCTGTSTDESKYYGNFVSVPYLVEPRALGERSYFSVSKMERVDIWGALSLAPELWRR